jgi:hypothetical protein
MATSRIVVLVGLVVLLSAGCMPTNSTDDPIPTPPTTPSATTTPTGPASPTSTDTHASPPPAEASLGDLVTLEIGASVRVNGLLVTLLDTDVPDDDDCQDCPRRADLEVTDGTRTEFLVFRFSGGMPPDTMEQARTITTLNHTFRLARVTPDDVDITVS